MTQAVQSASPMSTSMAPQMVEQPDPFGRFVLNIWSRAPRWSAPFLIGVCFAGGAAYTLISDPTDAGAASSPSCLVKLTTGFDCPGCGGTRAFYYLMHGNIPAAARSHLLAVFAAPFLVYMYIAWVARTAFRKELPQLKLSGATVGAFLGIWAIWSVLRNLPWAPFTWFFV